MFNTEITLRYSWFSLFTFVTFYKIAMNTELVNIEPLLLE